MRLVLAILLLAPGLVFGQFRNPSSLGWLALDGPYVLLSPPSPIQVGNSYVVSNEPPLSVFNGLPVHATVGGASSVHRPVLTTGQPAITLAAWVRLTATPLSATMPIWFGDNNTHGAGIYIGYLGNPAAQWSVIYPGGSFSGVGVNRSLLLNTWYHLVFVAQAGGNPVVKMYENGTEVGSRNAAFGSLVASDIVASQTVSNILCGTRTVFWRALASNEVVNVYRRERQWWY